MRFLPIAATVAGAMTLLLIACGPADRARFALPDLTRLPPGEVTHQPPGEALRNGYPVTPAPVTTRHPRGVAIMTRQVSQAEYAACVAAGAGTLRARYSRKDGNYQFAADGGVKGLALAGLSVLGLAGSVWTLRLIARQPDRA